MTNPTKLKAIKKELSKAQMRVKFRGTIKWQLFRKYMLEKQNFTCEFCGKKFTKTSLLNVHHRYSTDYENLDPARFKVLCWTCHQFIHKRGTAPNFKSLGLLSLKDPKAKK